ncbi:MAG: hypothetical protein ACOCSR_00060 [Wenzhouxiangella sp.]
MSVQTVNIHLQGANIFGAVAIAGLFVVGSPAVQVLALFAAAFAYASQMMMANAVATGSPIYHGIGWTAIVLSVVFWANGVYTVLGG